MTRLRIVGLILLATRSVFAAEPAPGAEFDDLENLLQTDVVSSASKSAERTDEAPAAITVVSGDQLRELGLRSLNEAINFLAVGMVSQDPLHSVEVGVRGVLFTADYGNHVLVVVDGHVMNEQWNGTAYFEQGLGIPLELVDHLELSLGPGSVLYGSSAMLGVINVVTRRARNLKPLQLTLEGGLLPPQGVDGSPQLRSGFGGTGSASLVTGWEHVLGGQSFEVTLGFQYDAQKGQSLTFPIQSGLTEGDGSTSWPQRWGARNTPGAWGGVTTDSWWTQVPSGLLAVRWGDFSFWARGAIYSRSSPAYDDFGAGADFDEQAVERDRWLDLELRWRRALSDRVTLLLRAYADFYDYLSSSRESSWLLFGGDQLPSGADPSYFTFDESDRGGSRWGGAEAQAFVDWLGDDRFPLLAGVDGRLKSFSAANTYSTLAGTPFDTIGAYDASEWQLAAYVQQRARLHPRLQVNVGLRLDMQSVFDPHLSPRAAVVWTTPWEAHLKAILSTGFRAPSGYERFAEYAGAQVRNPGLRPEGALTGELGYEQRFGRHRVSLGVFVSTFTDMIRAAEIIAPDGALISQYQNTGQFLNLGAQGELSGAFGPVSYAASFTGAANEGTEPLLASPTWFGNARVSYRLGSGLPLVSLLGQFTGPSRISSADATSVDANGTLVRWSPNAQWATAQLELRAVVHAEVPQVKGLWVRGSVGGKVMPLTAYVVGPRQSPVDGSSVPALAPNGRLYVFATVGYSFGAGTF